MKTFFNYILTFLMLFLGFGCKKENINKGIVGSWELRSTVGGMLPSKSYTAGNGNVWKFDGEKFEVFVDHKKVEEGSYFLSPNSDKNGGGESYLMLNGSRKFGVSSSKTKLVFHHGNLAADGVEQVFEKIN